MLLLLLLLVVVVVVHVFYQINLFSVPVSKKKKR